jgi:AAA family ATP:ADP antiporter
MLWIEHTSFHQLSTEHAQPVCLSLLLLLLQVLPQGLAGFVGMLRNWTFTLFFCMSELW